MGYEGVNCSCLDLMASCLAAVRVGPHAKERQRTQVPQRSLGGRVLLPVGSIKSHSGCWIQFGQLHAALQRRRLDSAQELGVQCQVSHLINCWLC